MSRGIRNPDPDWFGFVQVGDVLTSGNGTYRVVRAVHRSSRRGGPVRLRSVTFAIRRKSWTNRCYTVLNSNDLKTFGYSHVGARVKLMGEMDRKLARAIHRNELPPFISLHANDVRGVA